MNKKVIWSLFLIFLLVSCGTSYSAGDTWTSPIDIMTMVYVPAGDFLMGSAEDDRQADDDEKPQRSVYLDTFWIDQTEVTNFMFARFVDHTSYVTEAEGRGSSDTYNPEEVSWGQTSGADWLHPTGPASDIDGLEDNPVVHVSWNDAQAYCDWAGRHLPTDAEWEKAARGTDARIYPWGNMDVTGNRLNFADRNLDVDWADTSIDDGYQFTAPVGSYPDGASPYGALDMVGNVWEWVADWYDGTYYDSMPLENPTGPASGEYRVPRGGGWIGHILIVRAAYRWYFPDSARDLFGFRCARTP